MPIVQITGPISQPLVLDRGYSVSITPLAGSYRVQIPGEGVSDSSSAASSYGPYSARREVVISIDAGAVEYDVDESGGGQSSVSGAFGVGNVKRRILQALQLGTDRTQGVAATPPTATEGAASANSTLITTVSVYGVQILPTDSRIRYTGTVINAGSSGNHTGNHINETSATCANGWGASIGTDATSIEICVRDTAATRFRMRWREIGGFWQWASASDVVLSTTAGANFKFYRWDFGSSAPREIEVCFAGGAQFRGFVVSSGIGLTASSQNTARAWAPGQSIINGLVWGDSYTYGVGSTGCMDTWVHRMGDALGIRLTASGVGGQGYLALSNTGAKKARDRIADIDALGRQDLIVCALGINDFAQPAATLQAEVSLFWADVMARQPNSLIVHLGPWTAPGKICPTSVETAIKAGFDAVADPTRMIYMPILSESWQSTDILAGSNMATTVYGASGESPPVHVNNAGHAYLGLRAAAKVRQAIYTLASA